MMLSVERPTSARTSASFTALSSQGLSSQGDQVHRVEAVEVRDDQVPKDRPRERDDGRSGHADAVAEREAPVRDTADGGEDDADRRAARGAVVDVDAGG